MFDRINKLTLVATIAMVSALLLPGQAAFSQDAPPAAGETDIAFLVNRNNSPFPNVGFGRFLLAWGQKSQPLAFYRLLGFLSGGTGVRGRIVYLVASKQADPLIIYVPTGPTSFLRFHHFTLSLVPLVAPVMRRGVVERGSVVCRARLLDPIVISGQKQAVQPIAQWVGHCFKSFALTSGSGRISSGLH